MERPFIEDKYSVAAAAPPAAELCYPPKINEDIFVNIIPRISKAELPLNYKYNRTIKRVFDISFSLFLIVTVLLWMIPLFGLIIKLTSPGPVFFKQKRNGIGNNIFACIKFRTMLLNSEADSKAAQVNDTRITSFGGFLRRHHLDELPQLFNVLAGNMSLVGPRPYMIKENLHFEKTLKSYAARHFVKPGMTGLAQSFGYFGSSDDYEKTKERLKLDLVYIYEWTPSIDLKIVCRTLKLLATPKLYIFKTGQTTAV